MLLTSSGWLLAIALTTGPLALRFEPVGWIAPIAEGDRGLLEPAGVAVDPFGRIWLSDAGLHAVLRRGPDGAALGRSGGLGSEPHQLRRPAAIARHGTLEMAVLDVGNRRVVRYDLFGRAQGVLLELDAAPIVDRAGRASPVSLASDRGGALFVADASRDQVLAFDFSGGLQRLIGGWGARPGSFHGLAAVATAPHGQLVTAERWSRPPSGKHAASESLTVRAGGRIQVLDASGRALRAWPVAFVADAGMLAIAVDDSGRVAVADEASGVLRLFDASGLELARLEGLLAPRAVAFAPDGTLLVAEARRGVRRFACRPPAADR